MNPTNFQLMDQVFKNFPLVLNYIVPESYLDVGACKGHALPFIIHQLPSLKRIEAIEANKRHELDLKHICEQHNIPYKIDVLSDSIREVKFYTDGKGPQSTDPGASYLFEDTPHFNKERYDLVTTNTLDNIYNESDTFDLIKIDTQGSELDIIRGGLNLISRTKALILEENIVPFNEGAPLHSEVKKYVESLGFKLVQNLDNKNYPIQNHKKEVIPHHEVDTLYIRKEFIK